MTVLESGFQGQLRPKFGKIGNLFKKEILDKDITGQSTVTALACNHGDNFENWNCMKSTQMENLLCCYYYYLFFLLLCSIIYYLGDTGIKVNYNYFIPCKASSLNLKIIWSKRLAFLSFFGAANLYDEVKIWDCALQWEVMPFSFIEMSGWKLIALCYIQIMSSDIQNQLLQLILKSWHKPINKMNLQRDRNCSYWKEKNN